MEAAISPAQALENAPPTTPIASQASSDDNAFKDLIGLSSNFALTLDRGANSAPNDIATPATTVDVPLTASGLPDDPTMDKEACTDNITDTHDLNINTRMA
jgi:hypothetical protein